MLAKIVLAASLALGTATLVAQPRDAAACGDISPEQRARWVVEAHFANLAEGNAKHVRAQWWDRAAIISIAPDGTKTNRSLAKALPRWLKARKTLSWTVTGAVQRSDGAVEVTAEVTWNGKTYDDVMIVKYIEKDGLRIIAKRSKERATVAVAKSASSSGY
jgi:hypothetical protein